MWIKDPSVLSNDGNVEESVVREGYIVLDGTSVVYGPLLENKHVGRSVFGSVFHIIKVNPEEPLRVYQSDYGTRPDIQPAKEEHANLSLDQIQRNPRLWNAALFMYIPGDETTLPYDGFSLKKHLFPDSFVWKENLTHPVSLVNILDSSGVNFDGNYTNYNYSFLPPAQVGIHLYDWMTRKRDVRSHLHMFGQQTEGYIEVPRKLALSAFEHTIATDLENKFGEKIIFPLGRSW